MIEDAPTDHNEDYTVWTFTLRPGITFHDDTPLDAEAVVYNLQQHASSLLTAAAIADFGRNPDGTSNGIAYETAALLEAALPTVKDAVPHPLESAAKWLQMMAGYGITATSEMTYSTNMLTGYEALTTRPDSPVRMSLYHMAIDSD